MPRPQQRTQATTNLLPRARAVLASFSICLLFEDAGWTARRCILAGLVVEGSDCKMAVPRSLPRPRRAGYVPKQDAAPRARGIRRRAGLTVQPNVFEAPAVVNAVDHDRQPFDVGLAAARGAVVKDDRPGRLLPPLPVDLPHQLFALLPVGLHRLALELFFELRVAVTGDVALGAASIVLEELLVRIVDGGGGQIEADHVILADCFRKPVPRFDRVEFGVDIDVLQLVGQDDRGIAGNRDVADRQLDPEPVVRPIARAFHDPARRRPALLDIGVVARQSLQHLQRQAPYSGGRGQHGAADITLSFVEDVDERLAVEAQRHGPPDLRVVEGRDLAVDDQVSAGVERRGLADRLRRLALDVL